jgi:hypothetical protein
MADFQHIDLTTPGSNCGSPLYRNRFVESLREPGKAMCRLFSLYKAPNKGCPPTRRCEVFPTMSEPRLLAKFPKKECEFFVLIWNSSLDE